MKLLSFVLPLTLLFSLTSFAVEQDLNDWEKFKLKGKVKSLREFSFDYEIKNNEVIKGEKVSEIDRPNQYVLFDSLGNILELSVFNNEDSLEYETKYGYDLKGNKILEIWYGPENNVNYRIVSKYDNNGILKEGYSFNSLGILMSSASYVYDNKGNRLEENWLDSSGNLTFKQTFKYDKKGNVIEIVEYESESNTKRRDKWAYKYNKHGNVIESNRFNENDDLIFAQTFKYDKRGNVTEENGIHTGKSNLNYKYTYKYDNCCNKNEMRGFDSDGTPDGIWTFDYDAYGNVIQGTSFNPDGSIDLKITYKYEYDAQGNWTQQIVFLNDLRDIINEREFTYYD